MKFKVGDRVKIIRSTVDAYGHCVGVITTVSSILDESAYPYTLAGTPAGWSDRELELVETNNILMSIKEKFIAAFLSEPEKTFRKNGITNGDGLLTPDGQTVFLSYLLRKFGAEFKTEVVDKLEEDKE